MQQYTNQLQIQGRPLFEAINGRTVILQANDERNEIIFFYLSVGSKQIDFIYFVYIFISICYEDMLDIYLLRRRGGNLFCHFFFSAQFLLKLYCSQDNHIYLINKSIFLFLKSTQFLRSYSYMHGLCVRNLFIRESGIGTSFCARHSFDSSFFSATCHQKLRHFFFPRKYCAQ